MLNGTESELEVLTSKNVMPTRKEFNPKIDKDGKVDKTSLDHVLYLKKGVRVVLVHNIDVSDGLNNGAKRKVLDPIGREFESPNEKISKANYQMNVYLNQK